MFATYNTSETAADFILLSNIVFDKTSLSLIEDG